MEENKNEEKSSWIIMQYLESRFKTKKNVANHASLLFHYCLFHNKGWPLHTLKDDHEI